MKPQKAVSLFDQFSKLFEDNYAFFQVRGVDWEQQKRTYRSRITDSTSDDELLDRQLPTEASLQALLWASCVDKPLNWFPNPPKSTVR